MKRNATLAGVIGGVIGLVLGISATLVVMPRVDAHSNANVDNRPTIVAYNPLDQYRESNGLIVGSPEYQGNNQFILDGNQIGDNPLTGVQEYVPGPAGFSATASVPIASVMQYAKPSTPEVVDLRKLSAELHDKPIEQRAILDIMDRAVNRRPVNLLLGNLNALPMRNYADSGNGSFDNAAKSLQQYGQAFLYLETDGKTTSSVLVSYSDFSDALLDSIKKSGGAANTFYTDSTGVHYPTLKTGKFVEDWTHVRNWTARRFDGACQTTALSSNCLYKANQNGSSGDMRYLGNQQVILVTHIEQLEYDAQESTAGDRDIVTIYVAPFVMNGAIRVGAGYGQYVGSSTLLAGDRVQQLMKNGGVALSGSQLATLPTFRLED